MKVSLDSIKPVIKDRSSSMYYMVAGCISKLNSSFIDKPNIVNSSDDLSIFINPESPGFSELNELVNTGYVLSLSNSVSDSPRYHSYLTPISSSLILPSKYNSYLGEIDLVDPRGFENETYIIKFKYDESESSDGFYICIPTNYYIDSPSEFINPINVYIQGHEPEWVDDESEVFNIEVTGNTLGEVFDNLTSIINSQDESVKFYLGDYLAREVTNENGEFTICYKSPVKFVNKSISQSISCSYSYEDNVNFLSDYMPEGTVTFESKLIGDCSKLTVSYLEGLLEIRLGTKYESFEVNGISDSGKFIGDINSELINVKVNTEVRENIYMPEFTSSFGPITDLHEAEININESLINFSETELKYNFIIISDTLIDFDLSQIDTSILTRELLILSYQDDKVLKFINELNNSIYFSGYTNNLPSYIEFLRSVYECNFNSNISGVSSHINLLDEVNLNIVYPILSEFYTELKVTKVPDLNIDLSYDLNKLSVYQVIYVFALSQFILRYKYRLLHVIGPIGDLRSLISEFKVRFPSISSVEIIRYKSHEEYLEVELETNISQISNINEIKISFTLNI